MVSDALGYKLGQKITFYALLWTPKQFSSERHSICLENEINTMKYPVRIWVACYIRSEYKNDVIIQGGLLWWWYELTTTKYSIKPCSCLFHLFFELMLTQKLMRYLFHLENPTLPQLIYNYRTCCITSLILDYFNRLSSFYLAPSAIK